MFHNLKKYDSHLIFQKVGKYNFKIISKIIEKYMSFTIQQPKKKNIKQGLSLLFIDGAHFFKYFIRRFS